MPHIKLSDAFSNSGNLLPSLKSLEITFTTAEVEQAKTGMMMPDTRRRLKDILTNSRTADQLNLHSMKALLINIGWNDPRFMKQYILYDDFIGDVIQRSYPRTLKALYDSLSPEEVIDHVLHCLRKNSYAYGSRNAYEQGRSELFEAVIGWLGQSARRDEVLNMSVGNRETVRDILKQRQKELNLPAQDWIDNQQWPILQMAAQAGPQNSQMG